MTSCLDVGVRRAGVTEFLQGLEAQKVRASRGKVTILN